MGDSVKICTRENLYPVFFTNACMYICMYVCMHVCMYVYIYLYILQGECSIWITPVGPCGTIKSSPAQDSVQTSIVITHNMYVLLCSMTCVLVMYASTIVTHSNNPSPYVVHVYMFHESINMTACIYNLMYHDCI